MSIELTNLDLNITDFLLLQEISEMKLNRSLNTTNTLRFYETYKNDLNNPNIENYFYATVGSTTNLDNDPVAEYIGGAGKYTKISKTQADYFLDNFTIKDYYGNDNTGFSATVFAKNSDTNEITISFRSTEFGEDYFKDAYGADTEISNNGTAIAQNIAMLNYINKLRTDGIITTGTKINLTGYSLGGHLASSAYKYIETLPNVSIGKLYVFDGVGVGNVSNNQYGLLDNDLLQYNPILNIFNYFFENNITNSTVALNYVNGLNISQTVKDFFNFLSTKIHSVNPYDTSYELNYLLNNQSWFAKSFLGENEVEVAKSINEGNNKNSNYLNNTIYSSDLYINFSKFLINKFTLTKASSPDSSGSNIGDVIGDLVRGAQSDKTGDDTKGLFDTNKAIWINGQASVNNYDFMSNDFNLVSDSNNYGKSVSVLIEDRPEFENGSTRLPPAEWATTDLTGDFGNTHSITLLNKSLNLMKTLALLEGKSSLNVQKYSALISSSTKERAPHFYNTGDSSTGDANAISNIINIISKAIDPNLPDILFDDTLGGWADINIINSLEQREEYLLNHIGFITLTSLYNLKPNDDLLRNNFSDTTYSFMSSVDLVNNAKVNVAYRYALEKMNTFIIEGLDYSNIISNVAHSDEWYYSRANILLKMISTNVENLNNYKTGSDLIINDSDLNIYVNDYKQDIKFVSNNENSNVSYTAYNINSYYYKSQSFKKIESFDSSLLKTLGSIFYEVSVPAKAMAVLGGSIAVGTHLYLNSFNYLIKPSINFMNTGNLSEFNFSNNVIEVSENSSYFYQLFQKDLKILGADIQNFVGTFSYRKTNTIDKNIYFLDNYISNYQTNNSKNKNENIFINVDKNLLFSFTKNPANNSLFNLTSYTYKEGLSSAQTINDIDIRHIVHLGDGNDYVEVTDDGISNIFATSGKKNYYLKGSKSYITDPDKTGTITLDGILLDGGKMIMENGFADVNKRVQTFQSATELDDLGNPKEYKITYRFNTNGNNKNYIITNEQTGHQVIITGLSNFGNGSAFGFKELVSYDFNEQKNVSIENFSNDNVYTSGMGYISKNVTGYYDSTVDTEALANISINISNENIVATRDPNNLKDLVVYDKTNPSNIHTIANFFDELGALKEHVYYVFDGDNYNAQYLHYKINNTELSTILQYNPTMSSPGLTEMSPALQNQGYTSYELNTSLNIVLNYTPYAKYFLDNSLIASTGFKRDGNDLILYSLDYNVPQVLINGVLPTGTNIIKNYFAFDHSNTTNFYMHRYGQNIALSVSDLIQRTAVRLAENSSNYVMDENSYKTVVSGVGDDIVIGTEANETFISRGVVNYTGIIGEPFSDGNDTFTGGGGADIYSFSGNFGYDTITDFNNESIIYIDNSYKNTDYQFLKEGNDLIIYKELDDISEEYSQVTVKNYFTNIDYQNSSRIIFTRVQEHYSQLYNDSTYTPETYYDFTSSDIISFNTTDISKTSDEVIEQTAKDNSNNTVDTTKLTSSHIKGNDLDNTIIIRNNDTVIHSNQTAELTDGDDTYIIDIADNEAVAQNRNPYRTTIEFGFNSGHDLLLNAKFKQIAQYGDIVDLKDIDSNHITVNALKDENNVTVGFNLILQDGSSLLISVNDLSDTNVDMVKTSNATLKLSNLISMSSPSIITGDSMNNSFDLSTSIKSVSINALDGNDIIVGGQADDTIEGGRGFDKFAFSKGYDTYKFGINSDIDTFDMEDLTSNDILAISAKFLVDSGYKSNGISYAYNAEENEGYFKLSGSDGVVFSNVSWSNFVLLINNITVEFTDGDTPDMEVNYVNNFPFVNSVRIVNGTTGTDYLQTNGVYSNVIYGKDGNDTIVSSGNSNQTRNFLIGGKGSDTITANDGDFVVVKDGDGTDTIKTTDRSFVLEILHTTPRLVNNQETIFDVSAVNGSNDIKLKYGGTNDTVTIKDYFASNNNEITIALYDKTTDRTFVYENLADILSNMGLTKSYLLSHGAQTIYKDNTDEDMVSSVGQIIGGEIAYQYLNGTYLTDQNKVNHIIDNQLNGQPFQNKTYS